MSVADSQSLSYRVKKQLNRGEDLLLCLLLTLMLCIACVQIFYRSVLSGGLLWADPLLRYLVLWCGLLGALKATGMGKHIALDFSNYFVPQSIQPWLNLITTLFCTIVTAALSLASWLFIQSEMEFGGAGLFSLPAWIWNLIFPITFGLMTIRYGLFFTLELYDRFRSSSPHESREV